MTDNAVTGVKRAEPRTFDPDAWGASPHRELTAERSVYDDEALDQEQVPLARSLMADQD